MCISYIVTIINGRLFIHYFFCLYLSIFFNRYCTLIVDEPVWAIGTGLVCPSAVAQEVRTFVLLLLLSLLHATYHFNHIDNTPHYSLLSLPLPCLFYPLFISPVLHLLHFHLQHSYFLCQHLHLLSLFLYLFLSPYPTSIHHSSSFSILIDKSALFFSSILLTLS